MGIAKIRVGIVGLSADRGWAARAHLPALRALPDLELVAVATTRQASAQAAATYFGIPLAFGDALELTRHPGIDLVAVCVKVPHHQDVVMAAINERKHVYCEWPLGWDTAQAMRMCERARERKVSAMVGLQARGSPEVMYARELIANGYVGKVLSCTLISTVPRWGLSMGTGDAYTLDRSNHANILTIAAGHSLDILCHCLGEFCELAATIATRRTEVTLQGQAQTTRVDSPDQVVVAGTLENGAIVAAHIQGGTPHATKFLLEINGDRGTVTLGDRGPLSVQMAPLLLKGAQGDGGELRELTVPDRLMAVPASTPPGPPFNVAQLYARLSHCIRSGESASPDFADAVTRHRMLDAIELSAATGRTERLATG